MANHLTGAQRHNKRQDKIFKECLQSIEDRETANYRQGQIDKIENDPLYSAHIVLHGSKTGKTNFLSITPAEYKTICDILTEKKGASK